MIRATVDIFHYDDFRRFLKEFLAAKKAERPGFSHRYLIEKVGATSPGWLADVLQGRLRLSDRFLPKLAEALGLTRRETEYFEALVRFNQADTVEARRLQMDRMLSFRELRVDLVGKDRFDFYSAWYVPALRELLCCLEYRGDTATLAKKLRPPISPAQARRSLEILTDLKFVVKDAQGKLKPAVPLVKKDKSEPSPHLRQYLLDLMDLAKQSLERFPSGSRDVSCLTLALSEEGFREAKDELKRLRRKLLERAAGETRPRRVYQLNLQLFPLSE
jgi:uncharacterized protein (TIGR02147 family)